ncbi:hypothetical protein [Brevibacillus borstelensis]|uniref:hypothetical protein n=1 Tax=Brevibacillus borstelensis TaxID=45462 RepID=UPI0030BCFC42
MLSEEKGYAVSEAEIDEAMNKEAVQPDRYPSIAKGIAAIGEQTFIDKQRSYFKLDCAGKQGLSGYAQPGEKRKPAGGTKGGCLPGRQKNEELLLSQINSVNVVLYK